MKDLRSYYLNNIIIYYGDDDDIDWYDCECYGSY